MADRNFYGEDERDGDDEFVDRAFPDIPDFLLVKNRVALPEPATQAKPRARLPRPKRQRFDLPQSMEPAGWALLRQIEKEKREKAAQRFAALRERREAIRRSRTKQGVA